jgi:DHA2 family multidrug resistance protein-like MFS transporter
LSVAASVCCFAAQSAGLLALPFILQRELGQTPLMTGIAMTAWPVAVGCAALASGLWLDRHPRSRLTVAGGVLLMIGLALGAAAPASLGPGPLALAMALCGIGFGLFQVPNNRNLFLAAPLSRSAAAGGMQGTARLTGQVTGATLIGLLFALTDGSSAPRLALAIGAGFALLSAVLSARRTSSFVPAAAGR